MNTFIKVTTQFEGLHFWPDAPKEVDFLKYKHRHIFIVTAKIEVQHLDRELEFFLVREYMTSLAPVNFDLGRLSCEEIAKHYLEGLQTKYGSRFYEVEVSEDGQNSAIVRVL